MLVRRELHSEISWLFEDFGQVPSVNVIDEKGDKLDLSEFGVCVGAL